MISDTKKVHLMLSGHDHDNQHLSFTNKPELVICGTGSVTREILVRSKPKCLKYYDEKLSCCLITPVSDELFVQFYDTNKKCNYTFVIQK